MAPTGETGTCDLEYGRPICLHTCTSATAFALCEGGNGICTPAGAGKICLPKCGDAGDHLRAGIVLQLPRRANLQQPHGRRLSPGLRVGRRRLRRRGPRVRCRAPDVFVATCPGGCPTGSTCTSGVCVPSAPRALYADCTPSTTIASGCASNLCLSSGTSPGFCGLTCNSDDGDSVCGVGGVCWSDASRTLDLRADLRRAHRRRSRPARRRRRSQRRRLRREVRHQRRDRPAGARAPNRQRQPGFSFRSLPASPTLPAPGTGVAVRSSAATAARRLRSRRDRARVPDGVCEKAPPAVCPANTIPGDGNICPANCAAAADFPCPGSPGSVTPRSRHPRPGVAGLGCRGNTDCDVGYTGQTPRAGRVATRPRRAVGPSAASAPTAPFAPVIPYEPMPAASCKVIHGRLPPGPRFCRAPVRRWIRSGLGQSIGIGSLGVCSVLCHASMSVSWYGSCRPGYVCTALPIDPRVS